MPQTSFPIVGARFCPPAQALLDVLAVGTPLTLMAEPSNAFDPNAVAVWLMSKDIPPSAYDSLRETLPSSGNDLEEILGVESWHLGYIPKAMAAELKAAGTVVNDVPVSVTFGISDGQPRARFGEAPY